MGKGIIIVKEGQGAPFRVAPDANAEMIDALEPGTQLDLISYGDGWYLAEINGLRGYVAGAMIQALDGIAGLGKIKISKKILPRKSKKKNLPSVQKIEPEAVSMVKSALPNVKMGTKKMTEYVKAAGKSKLEATIRQAKAAGVTTGEIEQIISLNGIGDEFDNLDGLNGKLAKKAVRAAAEKIFSSKVNEITGTDKESMKKKLEILVKQAKQNGFTDTELKTMAALNGIGNLTDLQGVYGLKDLVKKVGSGIKTAAQKVVGGAKAVTQTADAVNEAKAAVANANAQTPIQQTVVEQPNAQPAVITVNPINNNQNQSTMTDETKSKIKKIAIAAAAVLGVATAGVIVYKKSKNKTAAANNGKGALNGVKKRRKKSKKSKKNTGNKLLTLK